MNDNTQYIYKMKGHGHITNLHWYDGRWMSEQIRNMLFACAPQFHHYSGPNQVALKESWDENSKESRTLYVHHGIWLEFSHYHNPLLYGTVKRVKEMFRDAIDEDDPAHVDTVHFLYQIVKEREKEFNETGRV